MREGGLQSKVVFSLSGSNCEVIEEQEKDPMETIEIMIERKWINDEKERGKSRIDP